MVVARIGEQVEHAAGGAGLGIARAEYDTRDPRMHHGHCAHHAWLQCHVQRGAGESMVGQALAGLAHCHDGANAESSSGEELGHFTAIRLDVYPQLYEHYEHVFDDWAEESES